jgi:hypothetical protein
VPGLRIVRMREDRVGRVVASGYLEGAPPPVWGRGVVVRLLPGGGLDPAFGSGGVADLGDHGPWWDFDFDAAGRVVVSGGSVFDPYTGSVSEFYVARLLPGGALDATFGDGGVQAVEGEGGGSVAVQPDGRIVAAGRDVPNEYGGAWPLVVRLLP